MAKLHRDTITYEIPTIPEVGAWLIFRGVTRREGKYGTTEALEYDAYEPMAVAEMIRIEKEAKRHFGVLFVEIHHRLGRVGLGEESMIVVVGSPHRKEGFKALEWVVEEVKHKVPIFKKEINKEGEFWIEEGTPHKRES